MLQAYPDFFSIHDLDKVLNDPNKAFSELRLADGFSEYIIEKKGAGGLKLGKIDIDKIFNNLTPNTNEFIKLVGTDLRKLLTQDVKAKLYTDFKGRCNITQIKLFEKLPLRFFFKRGLEATYDHRVPLSRGGKDKIENIQLISIYANNEKNRLCNMCTSLDCKHCALAFPEKTNIIQANGQDIHSFKK